LVAGDTNGALHIFVHDRRTGTTTRVSVDSAGTKANASSFGAALSANGRFVAFASGATNLVAGDTNGETDIFVHDRRTGMTARASVDSAGTQANSLSGSPALSADARVAAFESEATNLVAGDTNGVRDIFVHERQLFLLDADFPPMDENDVTTTFDPLPCAPEAPAGTFMIDATFQNTSQDTLAALVFEVATLTGGNVLCNADGGPRGKGARLTVRLQGELVDGLLEPGEVFDIQFKIGLVSEEFFEFFVDLLGELE
jgi:hypothetical protein